jgi:hypothetical protein
MSTLFVCCLCEQITELTSQESNIVAASPHYFRVISLFSLQIDGIQLDGLRMSFACS